MDCPIRAALVTNAKRPCTHEYQYHNRELLGRPGTARMKNCRRAGWGRPGRGTGCHACRATRPQRLHDRRFLAHPGGYSRAPGPYPSNNLRLSGPHGCAARTQAISRLLPRVPGGSWMCFVTYHSAVRPFLASPLCVRSPHCARAWGAEHAAVPTVPTPDRSTRRGRHGM